MKKRAVQYKIIVSDAAWVMLSAHIRFSAEVSPQAARKTQRNIVDEIKSLCEMPERFGFLEAAFIPPGKYHKMFVENWYLVLYQVRDSTICVDYILDGQQDYQWLF
ncbi:type II toxin-antitoxin system RelE/ParE family toxin [Oscillibacter sp.]|uniref:type II toxin-antitoxin system RelE/ParE family toxin n=1 Tax=Oscillibacter sp. TaxID=1945593 RepID=UPI0037C82A84